MELAFILHKYYPYGGLQRDFIKISSECHARGHSISVFTMKWDGKVPEGLTVHIMPTLGLTNHRRCQTFAARLCQEDLQGRFDLIVGFNKMPGLDVYFAADPCYYAWALRERSWLYRLSRRYRVYAGLEQAVFGRGAKTQILLLNPSEKHEFIKHHQTETDRFHLLPPGIPRRWPDAQEDARMRQAIRQELGLNTDEFLLLMVGSDFYRKGVDRTIYGLAGLPAALRARCRLVVLGKGQAVPLQRLARKMGLTDQVVFGGVKDEVSPFYLAADLLIHPARTEAAGMVLIEALVHGLPVLVTESCGYAFHVAEAGAGLLVPTPFDQQAFAGLLRQMLLERDLQVFRSNALAYAARTDLYGMSRQAADLFEQLGGR